MENAKQKEIKPFYKLWWFWVIIVLIILLSGMIALRFISPGPGGGILSSFGIGSNGSGNMSEEDRADMKEKMDNMTDEEREEMMKNRPTGAPQGGRSQGQMQN
jgi:hypothetical protein